MNFKNKIILNYDKFLTVVIKNSYQEFFRSISIFYLIVIILWFEIRKTNVLHNGNVIFIILLSNHRITFVNFVRRY